MLSPEVETNLEDLEKQPVETGPGNLEEQSKPRVERRLVAVPPEGLAKVIPIEEKSTGSGLDQLAAELNGSVQARKNLALLRKLKAKIDISDSSRAQISLGEGQDSLACALLYGLEITGWQRYPSRVSRFRPDTYEATNLLLEGKESGREQAYSFSDGELAIGYDSSGNAVFIRNIIKEGSKLNGLDGAPKQLLEAVLGDLDLETATAEIEPPLAMERARYNNHNPQAYFRP